MPPKRAGRGFRPERLLHPGELHAASTAAPKICLSPVILDKIIQGCLSNNTLADVFGNLSCTSVRCVKRPAAARAAAVNGTSSSNGTIVDTMMAFGNKYGSVLGAIGGGLATLAAAIIGWHYTRKKKTKLGQYLTHIDDTYLNFKMDAQECERELLSIKHLITEELKKGSIDEGTFGILDKKLDDYLGEVRLQMPKRKKK